MRTILMLIAVTIITVARAEPLPVEKRGTCPSNYSSESSYCVPMRNAPAAIPKVGTCPSGWMQSGDYCKMHRR